MLAYGTMKAAVHHLVHSFSSSSSSILPKNSVVVGVAPVTIDTPSNRAAMPKADFSTWTPPSAISEYVMRWSLRHENPVNGGLYKISTQNGKTAVSLVHPRFT